MGLLRNLTRISLRTVLVVVATLVGIELLYLLAGNAMLRTGAVLRLLNRHPEKTLVRYDSAYTLFPGHAVVKGLKLRNQATRSQIEAVADRVGVLVNPVPLLWKTVHVVRARARGVEFRMRRRPLTEQELRDNEAFVPPIEGLDYADSLRDPKAVPKAPNWGVSVTSLRVDEVREAWMDAFRVIGPGQAGGGLSIGPGRRLAVSGAWVRFPALEGRVAGRPFLVGTKLDVEAEIEPYDYGEHRGLGFLPFTSGRIRAQATTPGGSPLLNYLFRRVPWLAFDGAERRQTIDLLVEGGKPQPGSRVTLATDNLAVNFLSYRAEGKAEIEIKVLEGADHPRLDVELLLKDFGIGMAAYTPDAAVGERLRLHAVSEDDLTGDSTPQIDLELEIDKLHAKDLTRANYLLPPGTGLRIQGGAATLGVRVKGSTRGNAGEGKVTLVTDGLALDAGGLAMKGKIDASVPLSRGDLLAQRFAIDGTTIRLSEFDVAAAQATAGSATQAWWATFDIPRATFGLKDAPLVHGDVAFKLRDSRPLIQFFTAKKPLPKIGERILEVNDVVGKAQVAYGGDRLEIRDLAVTSDKIELEARLKIQGTGAYGDLLAVYDFIGVGVELQGASRQLHLLGARKWYESRSGTAAAAPAAAKPAEVAAKPETAPQPGQEKKPNWLERTFSKKK